MQLNLDIIFCFLICPCFLFELICFTVLEKLLAILQKISYFLFIVCLIVIHTNDLFTDVHKNEKIKY